MDATTASLSPSLQLPGSPHLSFDIFVDEILPKLPVKSLIRFKAVCKSFKTLISSPDFARLHLRHSLSSDNHRLLINRATDFTLHTLDLDSLSLAPSATYCWSMGFPFVVGSCDGLLLIACYIDVQLSLILLNPSTRSYVDIHLPAGIFGYDCLGFGFDHCGNDYKIVAVTCMLSGPAMVYSVNSNSWNVVDPISPSDQMYGCDGTLINNHLLHWMIWSGFNRNRCRIGCFDVCSEKWKDDLLFPDFFYHPSHCSFHFSELGVLDGLLYSSFINEEKSRYDVWVMNEYGVHESWVKLLSFKIHDLYCTLVPLACGEPGSNEVLLWLDSASSLIWYNRKDNTSKEAGVSESWDRPPYICKESLVSLPDAKLFGAVHEPEECAEEQRL